MKAALQAKAKTPSSLLSTFAPVRSGLLQRKCACGGTPGPSGECDACRKKKLQHRSANLDLSSISHPPSSDLEVPLIVHEVLRSPGQPLDAQTLAFMEPCFGHAFGHVRIHTDRLATESARAVNAAAYAFGRDLVFGSGHYAPQTGKGKALLAHELTHVVQQGAAPASQTPLLVSQPTDAAEQQAEQIATAIAERAPTRAREKREADSQPIVAGILSIAGTGPYSAALIQREPTRPRAVTGEKSIADLTSQTAKPVTGKVTAGSLSRQEWESLFSRHFTEPDKIEDEVESSHARYFYSSIYGWIDAQHFFAHIEFAEEKGLQGATGEGITIENKQEMLRVLIGPDPDDRTMYSDFLKHNLINADDFLHYRESLYMAIALGLDTVLSPRERALIKGFSERQLAKFILDNAISAWSYEDLISNQLGVQFFRLYGDYVNAGAAADEVRRRFLDKMGVFFGQILVINDPAAIKKLGARLPGKERWTAPKMTVARARKKFPELFAFDRATHRLRIAVYDTQPRAEQGKADVAQAVPSAGDLNVAPFGPNSYALYTGALSHFEAVLLKRVFDRAIKLGTGGALVEQASPAQPVTTKSAPGP